MKRFSILSIVGLLTLSLQSCFFSEDDIFEESSNQRIESALSEYQTLLTGAPTVGSWNTIRAEKIMI